MRFHQFGKGNVTLDGIANQGSHDGMGVPERHPPHDEPLGQVYGGHVRGVCRLAHAFSVPGHRGEDPRHGRYPAVHLVDRVEQRFLVLLEIPVVGEGQPFQGGEQPGQVSDQPAQRPRASSATSGFFFCGSIELPVA